MSEHVAIRQTDSRLALSTPQVLIVLLGVAAGLLIISPIIFTPLSTPGPIVVTVQTSTLYSGTASNSTAQGTARLELSFENPSGATKIVSVSVKNAPQSLNSTGNNGNVTIYQCPETTSCISVSTGQPILAAEGVTTFASTSSAFCLSTLIIRNQMYDYTVVFSNGEITIGSLTAT